jgi:tellurite resistance protein TehA-like permease
MGMRPPLGRAGSLIAALPPSYFDLVMSTGIVSIACHLLGYGFLAMLLFWLNVACYAILWLLFSLRLARNHREMLADFASHDRGVGFFTIVAGTCILGGQLVLLQGAFGLAAGLLALGAGLWLLCIYGLFTAFIIKRAKPSLAQGINGTWLVAAVSTQSLSILASLVSPQFPPLRELLLFVSCCFFLVGGLIYFLIIALIFYRLMYLPLEPGDLTPPYWVNMGAAAISTLAGSTLVASSPGSRFLQQLLHFLVGSTVCYWAAATWWLPLLFILGVWRHFIGKVDFSYSPLYWALVFPLGMYTACTVHLAEITQLSFLMEIPHYFIFVALTAWFLTFGGMLRSIGRSLLEAYAHEQS